MNVYLLAERELGLIDRLRVGTVAPITSRSQGCVTSRPAGVPSTLSGS